MHSTSFVEPLIFITEEGARAFILKHEIDGFAHEANVNRWVIICLTQNGVLAATSPDTGVVLKDW